VGTGCADECVGAGMTTIAYTYNDNDQLLKEISTLNAVQMARHELV